MRFVFALALVLPIAAPGAAAPQTGQKDVGEKAADPDSKTICKRFVRTGSLVDGYRVCKTKIEWQRERDLLRQQTNGTACQNTGMGNTCG